MMWTEFPNVKADRKTEHAHTWPELVEYVRGAGPFPGKASCPLLSLATYGTQRTGKESTRSAANVLAVHGIEADYDGEAVTMAEAVAALERHGIRAAVYPSPSWTAEKPRWRVIAPLATPCPPTERARMVARLNGALGGILADESFTLSQSFYFGRVNADWTVLCAFDDPTEGNCVDELPELDAIATGKHGTAPAQEGEERAPVDSTIFSDRCAALGRKLRTRDGRRELLKSWIASRSARGQGLEDIKLSVRGVVYEFFDPSDEPDWADIDKMAEDFVRKDYVPPVDSSALLGRAQGANDPFSVVSLADVFTDPPPPQEYVFGHYIPRGVLTLLSGHGGGGKSYFALQLSAHYAVGLDFVGQRVARTGRVLYFSAEDNADMIRRRFAQVCQADGLDPAEVAQSLLVLDATDNPALYQEDERGRRGEQTAAYGGLAATIDEQGVDFLVIDNASDTFDSDPINRRRVGEFIRWLVALVKYRNGTVLLLAHVNRATAAGFTNKAEEDYADSAAWHNKARSRLYLSVDKSDRRMVTISHQKANLGQLQPPLELYMRDSGGLTLRADFSGLTSRGGDTQADHTAVIVALIGEFYRMGQFISPYRTARNNAFKMLRTEKNFPRGIKTLDQLAPVLVDAQRRGLLEIEDYRTKDRKAGERWKVASAPSAPSAPSSDESADCAWGAPSAPTWAGGVGESARADEGAGDQEKRRVKKAKKGDVGALSEATP